MKKQYYMVVRLLLGFLFVIIGLGHSSVIDILGQKENQKELEATRISSTFAEKETLDGREFHQYHVRKLGFGENKSSKVIHKKESNMDYSVKEEKGSSERGEGRRRTSSSKISAEDDDGLNKSVRHLREGDDQKKDDWSSKSRKSNDSQISEEPHQAREEEGTNTQKDEEKAKRSFQVEEDEEVVNFIHMDYKGKAHRKPPINNHEPRN